MSEAAPAAELIAAARAWMLDDPDPETVAELAGLIERASADPERADAPAAGLFADAHADRVASVWDARDELALRFAGRLAFGTAGLRGEVGAGQSRMNSKVVMQTSAGFAAFLQSRCAGQPSPVSVVVGFDGRTKSAQFARDAASVFRGAGFVVTLLDGPLPTPLLAFAVRHLDASAGVMITASHNPADDNGYKVYLGDADAGSQIAPPVDAEIAALIDDAAALPLSAIAGADVEVDAEATRSVVDGYVAAQNMYKTYKLFRGDTPPPTSSPATPATPATPETPEAPETPEQFPTIVYTAMHGVGFEITKRVFAATGLPQLISVAEQQEPDSTFPTVRFPNPEEPGALDLAIAVAQRSQADLIIAHDPDADRLAVALPARNGHGYTQLTGNELGLLLGWECAERASIERASIERASIERASFEQASASAAPSQHPGALAATVVSSPALGAVAREYGLTFVQTLSGFKWVSRVPNLIFGFEEALGYLVNPDVIRDKDGISAAVMLVALASRLHADGHTLWDRLDEASMRFGHSSSDQITLRLNDSGETAAVCARIRSHPPMVFGEVTVAQVIDYLDDGLMPVPANVLRFDLADGSRVMIRPSGTEPKVKVYLDASCAEGTLDERRANAEARVAALRTAAEAVIAGALDAPVLLT